MTVILRRSLLTAVALTVVGAATFAPAALAGGADEHGKHDKHAAGPHAVGLTAHGALVGFDTGHVAGAHEIGHIHGLQGDERLVGIDYRVQDGMLYGVGNAGGLYTINTADAVAAKTGQLSVALEGESFGVDFNPAANALRVISNTGQNLRQPFAATPLAPTAVDTDLTNPAVAPATGTVPALGVTAAGYTNNDLVPTTATTLFDLDTVLDRVAVQSPANAGTLAPTGSLPADIGIEAGLDVYSTVTDGAATANTAFATVEVDGVARLWQVDLLTGAAQDLGAFGTAVTDLAVQLDA